MVERYGNIVGWGKQVPERVITNQDLEKLLDTSDEWIVSRTGIRERHVVSPGGDRIRAGDRGCKAGSG